MSNSSDITPTQERKLKKKLISEQLNGAQFNRELGEVVELGSIQVFDCPPILYSPPNMQEAEHK